MAQDRWYPAGSASASSIDANQGTPNTSANAWPVRITDGTHDATVTAGGALNVAIASGLTNPLPVTDAAAEASLASIDGKLNSLGQKTMANSMPVAIASDQSTLPISAASLPLPSGASTSAKQPNFGTAGTPSIDVLSVQGVAGGTVLPVSAASLPLPSGAALASKQSPTDIVVNYDYRSISYVGVTQKVDTIVYKTGGSGGTTVATQTFGYDGSDRITSITTT